MSALAEVLHKHMYTFQPMRIYWFFCFQQGTKNTEHWKRQYKTYQFTLSIGACTYVLMLTYIWYYDIGHLRTALDKICIKLNDNFTGSFCDIVSKGYLKYYSVFACLTSNGNYCNLPNIINNPNIMTPFQVTNCRRDFVLCLQPSSTRGCLC